jgi:DNA-directed RNA polymerase
VKVGALLIQTLLGAAQHGDGIASFIYTNNFYQHNQGYAKRKGFVRMDPAKYVEFGSLSAKDVNLLMPRYMPMVVHPKPWDNKEYSGAYHLMKAPIMKAISAQQSNAVRRGRMDSVLESLNYLGQIGWRINPVVHKVLEACVANKITLADMPSPENVPMPEESSCFRSVKDILADMKRVSARFEAKKKPGPVPASAEAGALGTVIEVEDEEVVGEEVVAAAAAKTPSEAAYAAQQKHAALLAELEAADPEEMRFDERLYKFKCSRIAKKNGELHSLRCDLEIKMSIADKFRDDVMFFPHNIDFRGRAYPIPPNLSHLGNDFCRGIMMFDKAKPLGPKGLDWLKIHLANLCGYNKVSMADRVAWADQHMEEIRDSVRQPLDGKRWWATVESPFQALAACAEIVAATDSGNPAEYMCRLPVHQDGSCNGLQHYAGLGRDAQGGSAVNLVPHEKPQDVYSNVLTKVLQRIAADKEIPEDSLQALEGKCARMLDGYVSRKVIKQTVMTSVYGVTHSGARAQVEARLQEVFELDSASTTPEREKEVSAAAQYLAKLTLDSLAEMFQSARSIMDWLGNCAKIVADQVSIF